MSNARKFVVEFEPDEGGAWNARIPSVRGCVTWGRSLDAARRYIREALATCVDVLGDDADRIARDAVLEEEFVLQTSATKALETYQAAHERLRFEQEIAQRCAASAARELVVTVHLSLRDAGSLLGLSHERISQLLKANPAKVARAAKSARGARARRVGGPS